METNESVPPPEPPVTSEEALGVMAAGIAKLLEKIESDGTAEKTRLDSMLMLREILDTHGKLLKNTLSPDNRLHPDISSYNPHGERDHPRPRLKRPCFIFGVPVEASQCTYEEIESLNWFTVSLEIPSRRWKALMLHDGQGGEILYFSKPFRDFEDTREFSAAGGMLGICQKFQAEGVRPENQDHLFDRIAQLEATLARMRPLLDKEQAAVVPPPAPEPVTS